MLFVEMKMSDWGGCERGLAKLEALAEGREILDAHRGQTGMPHPALNSGSIATITGGRLESGSPRRSSLPTPA